MDKSNNVVAGDSKSILRAEKVRLYQLRLRIRSYEHRIITYMPGSDCWNELIYDLLSLKVEELEQIEKIAELKIKFKASIKQSNRGELI